MKFDQLVGLGMLAVATGVFVYYSAWVFVLPFVDEDNFIQSFFLPREYAATIPLMLLLVAGLFLASFIGMVLLKQSEKEKLKQAKKKE
ncbi:Piso0_001031 [Millerozyma farinosa CBS 7064]|uniref:Dolichol phosphate-mannose biosynthesis regulatory protein n=1 Tax=Pichia sorbitophila (strain ATCC MYA-4447 / BCRC 22081 / CBS 7064 / NBRC 10061 / NRRL Y-12695) TaxID=559304 RepID=G8YS71_PICSO|nr:Piso0_001031 [Millerozyma farinosa CBS 7064]CCE78994.1 Piso0_001031 [Millerozyma farinosa CBS 7064]